MSDAGQRALPAGLDVERVRADFPCLDQMIHGRPLVFLDTATSAQKPQPRDRHADPVLRHDYANIHRGVYELSQRATDLHEGARAKMQALLNAANAREIVFTRSGTEGINLVAQSFVRPRAKPGDEVLITGMEHHANIVPWQLLADQAGLKLVVAPINDDGELLLDAFEALISERTRLVSVTWVSNALGTDQPGARDRRARACAAACRCCSTPPRRCSTCRSTSRSWTAISWCSRATSCTALPASACSTARPALLEAMPPYQGGGDMILSRQLRRHRVQRAAVQVRGRHAGDRSRGRPRRRDRLRALARPRQHRRARGRSSGLCHPRDEADPGPAPRRHGARQVQRPLLRPRPAASARHRHAAGSRWHRGARRPSLRDAGDRAARRRRHHARLARRSTTPTGEIDALVASLRRIIERFG